MKSESIHTAMSYAGLLTVGLIIVVGFSLVGSPSFNRKITEDKMRVEDLEGIESGVRKHFDEKEKLPLSLSDLKNVEYYSESRRITDPVTNKPYSYRTLDAFSYELCAEFTLSTSDGKLEERSWGRSLAFWEHEAGSKCFKLEIPESERKKK